MSRKRTLFGCGAVLMNVSLGTALGQLYPPYFHDEDEAAVFCTMTGSPGGCSAASPMGLDIADVLGTDDRPDVAVANYDGDSVSILRNTGNWAVPWNALGLELNQNVTLNVGVGRPYDVEFADMDGDNDQDLVVSIRSAPEVVILYNNGAGSYGSVTHVPVTSDPIWGLAVTDIDLDGRNDVAVSGGYVDDPRFPPKPRIEILSQRSPGTFVSRVIQTPIATEFAEGTDVVAREVRTARPIGSCKDLVMSMFGSDSVALLLSKGDTDSDGTMNFSYSEIGAHAAMSLTFAKLRPGEARDVITTEPYENSDNNANVILGSGTGTFEPVSTYSVLPFTDPYGIDTGQLNLFDTKRDLVVACRHGGTDGGHGGVAVLVGNGNGTFQTPAYYFYVEPTGVGRMPKPFFVQVSDMNQDGLADIVTSNTYTGSVSVLINSSVIPIP